MRDLFLILSIISISIGVILILSTLFEKLKKRCYKCIHFNPILDEEWDCDQLVPTETQKHAKQCKYYQFNNEYYLEF